MKKYILFFAFGLAFAACYYPIDRENYFDFGSGKVVALEDCSYELKKAVVVQVVEEAAVSLRRSLFMSGDSIDGVYYGNLIRLYISQDLYSKLRVGSIIGSAFNPASGIQCNDSVYDLYDYVAFDDKTGLNSF